MVDFWLGSLVFLVAVEAKEFYLSYRQSNKLQDMTIPKEVKLFENLWKVNQEEYVKSKQYGSEKMRVSMYRKAVDMTGKIFIYYFGAFKLIWKFSKSATADLNMGSLLAVGLFMTIQSLLDLFVSVPFSYYSQFVIEEKYQFSKMTRGLFFKDKAIEFGMGVLLGTFMLEGLVWITEFGGSMMPYYCSIFLTVSLLLILLIWPNFIAPLFNKFEKLGESGVEKETDLRDKVYEISRRAGFPVGEIYKMDGSKRSHHSNAYFFGVFQKKRIVIFDTLINQMENIETEAVMCHEIGHWYHMHNVTIIGPVIFMIQILCWLIGYFIYTPEFYTSFGFTSVDKFVGVNYTLLIFGPVSSLFQVIQVAISRYNEFQADEYALRFEHGDNLIRA